MKINPMETAPFEREDFDEAPSNIFVHKGAWATITGTNDKLAGWVDTHELFADHLYRDQILTKQYTNTREPGEFGDGVTVEKMTDEELVEKLRTVNIATAPYACPEAVDWCHEAADRLEAALPHVSREAVRVMPLEWEEVTPKVYDALGIGILYRAIKRHDGTGELRIDSTRYGQEFPSLSEAKAVAQADYERRIMSAIEVS